MSKRVMERDSTRVYLKVENPNETEDQIDLVNVASAMGKRKKLYFYFLFLAVFAGVCFGLIVTSVQNKTGENFYASAVIDFQYPGIEDGLDPNGAYFDINKIKSPTVIEAALQKLNITNISTEDVRRNIMIEGVIPEDAQERITVIKEISAKDASYYEKILDVSYFPSQYIVYLYLGDVMSSVEATEILNAVLESYRDYFMDTYANTEVLTVTTRLFDCTDYDYIEAVDILQSQINIMKSYVGQRKEQAPDFRSSATGLTFGDIKASLQTIENIELSKISSYIENVALTKDIERFQEQYSYRIKMCNMDISELQAQLTIVENTIETYTKDPIVIVSSQESTQEISQKNEYYDSLIDQKLELTRQIGALNTELSKYSEIYARMAFDAVPNTEEQYVYADALIQRVVDTISEWVALTEETTKEYYSTTLFSNAYKISVPAKYHADGGFTRFVKLPVQCAAVMVFVVIVLWCMDGLRIELTAMRNKKEKT